MLQRANRFLNMRGRAINRDEMDSRLAVLRLNPIFGSVPAPELELLASMFDVRVFANGERICAISDRATEMYVMVRGSAQVEVAGQPVGVRLERGQAFGEYGLFGSGTRSATSTRAMTRWRWCSTTPASSAFCWPFRSRCERSSTRPCNA
jgi:hypothetical protein